MANFKRKKSKRTVKCTLCTPDRWKGNNKDRFDTKETVARAKAKEDIDLAKSTVDIQD